MASNRCGILILISVLAFSMSVPSASAQAQAGDGIYPDSFFYGFDVFIDNIILAFTSGDVEKARLSLKIAEERLQEVKLMIEQNKLSATQTARAEHEKMLSIVEDSVEQIETTDGLEEIKDEIEIEKEVEEHKTEIKRISGELKIKIKIRGELTSEQQSLIASILEAMEGKAGEVKIKIDNEKQKTKIKIKQQTGKSDEEIEDEVEELEVEAGVAELEVKAEIIGEQSEVKVEKEFSTTTTDRDALIDEIIQEFALGRETADSALELETEEEEEELEEEFKVEVEVEEGVAEVEVKLKFILDTTDREVILDAIVENTQLTREQIEEALEFETEETEEEELEIEVEIEDNLSDVKVKFGDEESEFTLETTDRETIISEIISRTGLTREQIESVIEIGTEEELDELEEKEIEEENVEEEETEEETEEEESEEESEEEESESSGNSGPS